MVYRGLQLTLARGIFDLGKIDESPLPAGDFPDIEGVLVSITGPCTLGNGYDAILGRFARRW
jgi:hypothetical protein